MEADASSPFARLNKNWLGDFSSKLEHQGHEVTVTFEAETKEELEELLPTAEQFWRDRENWFKTFHDHVVAKFLKKLNDRKPVEETKDLSKTELSDCVAVPFAVNFYFDDTAKCCAFSVSAGNTKVMFEYVVQAHATLKKGFKNWELVSLI